MTLAGAPAPKKPPVRIWNPETYTLKRPTFMLRNKTKPNDSWFSKSKYPK